MEKNYVVMTDSSADLNPALEQELGVDIIPLSVNCGDRTFLDYPDEREIKTSEFYGMLRSGANAKTAAANVETFLTAMSRHLEQGKDVLYLGFSSGLSSTYSASEIAAQELRERYPERKVLTVDTLCASMGQGLLVWLTVQELKHGATLEEAARYAEDNRLHLCHWFTVDDLFFLKPVLHVDNEGHLINVSKARGRKNSILALVDRMERSAIEPEKQTVFISHGDCLADAEFLAQEVRRRLHVPRIEINYVGPVIGAPCSSSERSAEAHKMIEKTLRSIAWIAAFFSDVSSALERAQKRDLVGIFQLTADGDAVGKARHAHLQRAQQAGKIHGGRLALRVRIRGHDDLAHAAPADAPEQLANAQIVRTDLIQRGDHAVQHMIHAVVFPGALHGDNVLRLRHDADEAVVALLILADGADVAIRQVLAHGAQVDGPPRLEQGVGEFLRLLLRLGQ